MLRPIRLLLLLLMLAFLPVQSWACGAARVAGAEDAIATTSLAETVQPVIADADDPSSPPADEAPQADSGEASQAGVDLAEQLLPGAALRIAAGVADTSLPRYAAAALPDPDLPRLSRPPRG